MDGVAELFFLSRTKATVLLSDTFMCFCFAFASLLLPGARICVRGSCLLACFASSAVDSSLAVSALPAV